MNLPPVQHFAQLDDDNLVINVIVATQEFIDSGAVGDPSRWVECATDGSIRTYYPRIGAGDYYDPELDEFRPLKPFPSWIWNNYPYPLCSWVPPIMYPGNRMNGRFFLWDEPTVSWVEHFPLTVPYPVNDQGWIYRWNELSSQWVYHATLAPGEVWVEGDEHWHQAIGTDTRVIITPTGRPLIVDSTST